MKKLAAIFVLSVLSILKVQAQYSSDYIQYMFNGLLINPAYAGSADALNITSLYRKQWVGITGAPANIMLSAHSPLKNKKVNLGFILLNDRFGVYDHLKAALIYSYRIKFEKGNLAFGLQGGIDSYSTNWNMINTTESGDPNFGMSGTRTVRPEAGAGIYFHSGNFYVGAASPDLFTGQLNHYYQTNLTAGCILKLNDDFRIKPAILIKQIRNSSLSTNASATFYYKTLIGLGLGYTYKNSVMAYADIKINDQLTFGYGYAYMLNDLKTYSSGTHEIMLRYLFRYKLNAQSARYFN